MCGISGPSFPFDEFIETQIYSDAIESVDLSALLTPCQEKGVHEGNPNVLQCSFLICRHTR